MRALSTLVAILAVGVGVAGQQADLSALRPNSDAPMPVATFTNVELQDALKLIAEGRGLHVEFAPEVNARRKIGSFTLTNIEPVAAIKLILKVADVSAIVVDETTLRVVPKP